MLQRAVERMRLLVYQRIARLRIVQERVLAVVLVPARERSRQETANGIGQESSRNILQIREWQGFRPGPVHWHDP